MKGLVIAGTHSSCGKTTVTLGILAALRKRGVAVQSFKAGPDFIDAGLHKLITGVPSRNLDIWMCGEEYVKNCFNIHSKKAHISIVEGVMGLFDGNFSTYRLAKILNLPIILAIDAYGMAESAGAIVKGFLGYAETKEGESIIKGVIFNRVGSERHFERLTNSVHDVPVLGYLPRNLSFEIPHRHLGLTVAEENPIIEENIERLADAVLEHIDVTLLVQKCAFRQAQGDTVMVSLANHNELPSFRTSDLKVAVAYDKAFCFYYEDNLDLLKDAGAEIVSFSPLSDSRIPANVDALYIGGGYPEIWAKELSQNRAMLKAVYDWAESGKPIYAECGGLMYLSKGIYDFDGNFFKMAGIFPFETEMKNKRAYLGYREVILKEDCIIGKKGNKLRGHEFHYSEIKPSAFSLQPSTLTTCYSLFDNTGQNLHNEGYRIKNTFASYIHIHFGSNVSISECFVNFIKEGRQHVI